jgi:hypothetical protein
MGAFEKIDGSVKKKMVGIWEGMDEEDKNYFVDQVALALSVWGCDERGKLLVAKVVKKLVEGGSKTLADFGLYIDEYLDENGKEKRRVKMQRASGVISRYRLKNALSSVPHKDIEL